MRELRRAAVALSVCALAVGVAATVGLPGAEPADAAVIVKQVNDGTPRPLGPITVLGDSVLLGSLITSPMITDQLAAHGWGPIRARAGGSYSTGEWLDSGETRITYWIARWRAEGWDAPNVVINLGANDSGVCSADVACARRAIMYVVDAIGPGHQIWWPQITRHWVYDYQAAAWNQALREIAAERDDFHTWDWPAVMASGPFPSEDNTHLSPSGYRLRSALMADEITADLARGVPTGAAAALPPPAGEPSELVPVPTTRVLDTRTTGTPVGGGREIVVDVGTIVPAGATAVAAYVSATDTAGDGFLTAYECGTPRPTASAANYRAGQTRGAVTITPLTDDRRFCLYTLATAHLLVDVQAAFVPAADASPHALRLQSLDTPQRLADTRSTGRAQLLTLAAPDGAEAVAVNVTAVGGAAPGYLVAYPCGIAPPASATVNHLAGEAIAGAAFVPVGPDGTFCVWSLAATTDVVVDLTGIFVRATAGAGGLAFVPVAPTRTFDTRDGTGGWEPIHGQGQTFAPPVAPAGARAVSGTLTIAGPLRPGFLRGWGCGPPPATSNVNAAKGAVLANFVTTGVAADGRLCVYAEATTTSIFDTTGWWVATP